MGTGLLSPLTSWGRDSLGKAGRGVGGLGGKKPGQEAAEVVLEKGGKA